MMKKIMTVLMLSVLFSSFVFGVDVFRFSGSVDSEEIDGDVFRFSGKIRQYLPPEHFGTYEKIDNEVGLK